MMLAILKKDFEEFYELYHTKILAVSLLSLLSNCFTGYYLYDYYHPEHLFGKNFRKDRSTYLFILVNQTIIPSIM